MRAIPKRVGAASGESSVVSERFAELHVKNFLEIQIYTLWIFSVNNSGISAKFVTPEKLERELNQ